MELENIKINCTFDENLLRFSNEVITGQISISIGTFTFPSLYWNDFVAYLLEFWSDAIINLYEGISFVEDFTFMDGSYNFIATKYSEDQLEVLFYEDNKRLKNEFLISIYDLKLEIEQKINALIRYIIENRWDYDISSLQKRLKQLRKIG